jgi:hypothetical protein
VLQRRDKPAPAFLRPVGSESEVDEAPRPNALRQARCRRDSITRGNSGAAAGNWNRRSVCSAARRTPQFVPCAQPREDVASHPHGMIFSRARLAVRDTPGSARIVLRCNRVIIPASATSTFVLRLPSQRVDAARRLHHAAGRPKSNPGGTLLRPHCPQAPGIQWAMARLLEHG